jgi:hypothetical protein
MQLRQQRGSHRTRWKAVLDVFKIDREGFLLCVHSGLLGAFTNSAFQRNKAFLLIPFDCYEIEVYRICDTGSFSCALEYKFLLVGHPTSGIPVVGV